MRREVREMKYKVGDRVVIVKAEGTQFGDTGITCKDPTPEHTGKCGKIIQAGDIEKGIELLIELEDGTILKGSDCWWKKLARGW